MKTLEESQERLRKICEAIKNDTLEPAKKEADRIIEDAKKEAGEIIDEAKKQAGEIIRAAKESIEQERNIFHSALAQAGKQSIDAMRQSFESFFNKELAKEVEEEMADPNVIARIISSINTAIEKDGLEADLEAAIAKSVRPEEVNRLLASKILNKLKNQSVEAGPFKGGAQVKLAGKNLSVDMSDDAIKDLLSVYLRKDFRKLFFK